MCELANETRKVKIAFPSSFARGLFTASNDLYTVDVYNTRALLYATNLESTFNLPSRDKEWSLVDAFGLRCHHMNASLLEQSSTKNPKFRPNENVAVNDGAYFALISIGMPSDSRTLFSTRLPSKSQHYRLETRSRLKLPPFFCANLSTNTTIEFTIHYELLRMNYDG